ncbi:DUF6221 family protein [Streptomyces rochei]|uniref:DUF6221 family protein n=1 Tax=Streptomyces rochei TaxID=1928 RepID=UPI003530FB68
MDLHAWITQRVDEVERTALKAREDIPALLASGDIHNRSAERHIAANAPVAVLRRCDADRRILARHRAWPGSDYCDYCDADLTTRLADCPELLDLARAHGITDEILAGLDRTQQPEPEPRHDGRLGLADILAPRTRMREVPPALRGPNWKP